MRNYFTIAGVDSRDFGLYISGHQTFGSPEKSYDEYEIPGRNGTLLGSNKRFQNAEYVYECGIKDNIEENLANLRTFLGSLDGYQRLEDTYHPDEFRMAVLMDGIEPDMTQANEAGEFEITFQCLPQRFLKSGDAEYTVGGGTITGNPIYTDLGTVSIIGMTVSFKAPYKDYNDRESGESPQSYDPMRAVYISANNSTIWGESQLSSLNAMEAVITAWKSDQTSEITVTKECVPFPTTGWEKVTGYNAAFRVSISLPGTIIACSHFHSATPFSVGAYWVSSGYLYVSFGWPTGAHPAEECDAWMQENKPGFVCSVNVTQSLGSASFITLPEEWGTLSALGVTVGGKIYNSNENLTISCAVDASDTLINPTRFASKPLIRVAGNGTATINGQTITIVNSTQYVDIDCDMMDCYEGSTNRNKDVTFSTYDFPELVPGDNTFVAGTGITGFVVTPRWWRL